MRRWDVMAVGHGASISSTFYARTMEQALDLGRRRFLEVHGRPATLAQASDLGPGREPTAPFEIIGKVYA